MPRGEAQIAFQNSLEGRSQASFAPVPADSFDGAHPPEALHTAELVEAALFDAAPWQ